MKQQFELGTLVWAFKHDGDKFLKATGVVKLAEINKSGYVQYQISTQATLPTGEVKEIPILANHASMALTESEIDAKIKQYHDWLEENKASYEKVFGAPEYDPKELDKKIAETESQRGK